MASDVGLYIPPQPESSGFSINRRGEGRVPTSLRDNLVQLLEDEDDINLRLDLDFHNAVVHDNRILCNDTCLNDLDLYFWYAETGRTTETYGLEILKHLSHETEVILDPYSFETTLDKYHAHCCLRRNDVSVPETVLFNSDTLHKVKPVLDEWGRGLLKPRKGGFGKGVTLIEEFTTLRDVVDYIESSEPHNSSFLLERFYPNDPKEMVCVTLFGDEILYGYRKTKDKWADLSNGFSKVYSKTEQSGSVTPCDIPPEVEIMAKNAQNALGNPVIGFDVIFHDGDPLIIDENTYPGLYPQLLNGLDRAPSLHLRDIIVGHLDTRPPER